MKKLSIQDLSFSFSNGKKQILKNISFEVHSGEIIAILGASGSGKSTLLRILYGLENYEKGTILYGNEELSLAKEQLIPGHKFMKFLHQEFDLMPHHTVKENVGKHLSNFFPEEKEQKITALLELMGLLNTSGRKPSQLSGGQKQRLAWAQQLAQMPEVILLDEPFSHLDAATKNNLRERLFTYFHQEKTTVIFSTHDVADALAYADKIMVIDEGEVLQIDTPKKLFNRPKNQKVAKLLGGTNLLTKKQFHEAFGKDIKKPFLLIHLHQIKIDEKSTLKGIVKQSYFQGNYYLLHIDLNNVSLKINHFESKKNGETLGISLMDYIPLDE